MKHFILTRFNDYFPCFDNHHDTQLNPNLGLENEWVAKRLTLFWQITVPSVVAQTDQEFTWILKCHPLTPSWVKEVLVGNFVTCYDEIPPQTSVDKQASLTFSRIVRQITSDHEIITTRLDSDDALSRNHIEIVKKSVQPNKFFDFNQGIVKTGKGIFRHAKGGVSQFCSYFEVSHDLKTVYHKFHNMIGGEECITNKTDLGWMQTNHRSNITSSLKQGKIYNYKVTNIATLIDQYPFLVPSWVEPNRLI